MATGLLIAVVACAILGVQSVGAIGEGNTVSPWLGEADIAVVARQHSVTGADDCSNATLQGVLNTGYAFTGCVQGADTSVRVVRYSDQQGYSAIAIAYPGESSFSEVRGICYAVKCAYSAARDVLIDGGSSRFYTNFSKYLLRKTNPINGKKFYEFQRLDDAHYIESPGPMPFNALAVSSNGDWAVVEVFEYGFVRVNLKTFHQRRVAISGATYNVANDPYYELAISNSGNELAVGGFRTRLQLYVIDDYCGDVLTASSHKHFMAPAVSCRSASLSHLGLQDAIRTGSPTFTHDALRLAVTVRMNQSRQRVVIGPSSTTDTTGEGLAYLAMGDSYTSGEGESDDARYLAGTNQTGNKCHVSHRSYPFLLVSWWNVSPGRSVACSGAQINDVLADGLYRGQAGQVPSETTAQAAAWVNAIGSYTPGVIRQSDFLQWYQPTVATLGVGGNDVGLMGKLATCLGIGTCEWASDTQKRRAVGDEIQRLYGSLRQVVAAMKDSAPATRLMLVGYPRIINEASSASCSPVLGTVLSPEERLFMDESIKLLNDTIHSVAIAEGVAFIDIEDALVGQRLCEGDESAMNSIRLGDDIAPIKSLSSLKLFGAESFHPTPTGHALIRDTIITAWPGYADDNCFDCQPAPPDPPSAYWSESSVAPAAKLIKYDTLRDILYISGQKISLTLNKRQFYPGASVRVELHSSPRTLGTFVATEDGDGQIEVTIPSDTPSGHHTLHLFSDSWSGESVDFYQVIRIENVPAEEGGSTDEDQGNGVGGATNGNEPPGTAPTPETGASQQSPQVPSQFITPRITGLDSIMATQQATGSVLGATDMSSAVYDSAKGQVTAVQRGDEAGPPVTLAKVNTPRLLNSLYITVVAVLIVLAIVAYLLRKNKSRPEA